MTEEKKEVKEEAPDLEALKARLDVSVNMARSLVTSWLPSEEEEEEEKTETIENFKGRAPRLGLGAKFLSHAQGTANAVGQSLIESKMKRKLTAIKPRDEDEVDTKKVEEQSEDEDSRTATTGNNKKSKKAISGGDFLSQYLNERRTKKKKNKK
ncbi:hypothetical protein K7432_002690 [Basidiobolus ranarum]|uniref:Uncharacterized protein n=1 Tax=Basidiobolus ranarum TaxID=34480 RepID=A0ABR2W7D2_9FUNG